MSQHLTSQELGAAQKRLSDYERLRPDVVILAMLASMARKIEPELLRALRFSLSDRFLADQRPNVGTEAALWFSSFIESRGPDGITLLPEFSKLLRERLRADSSLLEATRKVIQEIHEKSPPIICWEENLIYLSLSNSVRGGERKQLIDHEVWKVAKAISTDKRPGLEEWIVEMGDRLPEAASQDPLLAQLRNVSQIRILQRDPFASDINDFTQIAKLDFSKVPTVVLDVLMVSDVFRIGFLSGEGEYGIRVPNIEPITLEILDSTVSRKVTTLVVTSGEYGEISVPSNPIRIRTIDGRIYLIDPKLFKKQEVVVDASTYDVFPSRDIKNSSNISELVPGGDQLNELPAEIERQMHEAFVDERSHLHIGRIEEAAQLTQHVKGTNMQPVVIIGESGSGKSAFLASWYRQYAVEHPDDHVLAYFIGASPDSTDHLRLLRNMCKELKSNFNLEEILPEDDKKLSELLMSLLMAASKGRRIVILLDALDQLSAKEGAHGLGWLLDYLPINVHLVVSSLEDDSLEVLRQRGAKEIALRQLTAGEQRQIVYDRLSKWGRKLDEQQISALLAHPGVENPLYLRVALEELRLFGRYEQLTGRIQALAHDVSHLFEQVLARLEEDHGREFVAEAFSLLGCSRYGLSENELLELLRREGEEQLPRALWIRLFRSAKAYLIQRGELVGFFHRHLADAVSARYLIHENRHSKLAEYFNLVPFERRLDEYPYQLHHAKEWNSLATALSDLDFFEYAWDKGRKYEWMAYWESLKESYDPEECYQKAIDKRLNSTGKTVEIAISMNKIGKLFSGMSFFIPALSMFENSFGILEPILGSDHPEVAALLYNTAQAYDRQYGESKAELVVQYYNDAYEKYMKLGKPLEASEVKIESANFKRRALKKLKEAKKDCEEAKKTLESINENNYRYKLLYAQCLNILGLIYSGLEEPELVKQCQNLFQQSINFKKEVGDLDSIGESENAMGLFLRNTANRDFNKINEAIDHLKIALEIRNSIGNYRGAAQSCRNLGLCYTDRIDFIEDIEKREESYRLAKQSYLNGINYWNKRKGKPPIEELLEFKYRLGELIINHGNKKEGINILEELQEERNRIGDWHNRARALDLLLKAYRGTNESKITAHKIITIYQNVLADGTKLKQIYEGPVRFKDARNFLERIINEVPEYEVITSKILEDISKIFDDNRR